MAKVLLVDDDEAFVSATVELLTLLGHDTDIADSVASARSRLESRVYDRVLLDLMLPDGSGFHVLENLPLDSGRTRATIITGHDKVKSHVMALYGPNVNYLVKPITLEHLTRLFESGTPSEDDSNRHFGELIGESRVMHNLYSMIERVAASRANVMLFGESGAGKEVVARAIHRASSSTGELVAANCGAFPAELLGSELFGHEKGAFTGATSRRTGLFERAEDGTLFLDEITEMPLADQPSLLRALETRTVTRVGGNTVIPVNCRVVAATNRSEEQLVNDNCLREDLYYRLAVFPIHIPPLREHMEDIPLLAESFLAQLNQENDTAYALTEKDMARLGEYDWPGNIRELRHTIHRGYIMTPPGADTLELPDNFSSPFARKQDGINGLPRVGQTIEAVERDLIMRTLAEYDNNKTRAAEVLGVSVKTLYNRLNEYDKATQE